MSRINDPEIECIALNNRRILYTDYINEHRRNVRAVWDMVVHTLNATPVLNSSQIKLISSLIEQHDDSKYRTHEFEAYRQNFFPLQNECKDKMAFKYAWNHHQKANPHHWQYWIMNKPQPGNKSYCVVLPMGKPYLIEMLCDWAAMSVKFGDLPSEFYAAKKDEMLLHQDTRNLVEKLLHFFDTAVQRIHKERIK